MRGSVFSGGALVCAAALLVSTNALAAPAPSPAQVTEGKRLYNAYCVICHGETGKGNGALASKLKITPADLADNERMNKRSDADILHTIETGELHGKALAGMPRWGKVLTADKVKLLATYVRYLSRSRYPTFDEPDIGQGVYEDYCASCHGMNGKGEGILTKVIQIKPADHTNAAVMGKLSDKRLISIITDGDTALPLMPAWRGILTESEIEAVVRYIRILPQI
jgi:cytochrome c oxidase cbb3-type subunit III